MLPIGQQVCIRLSSPVVSCTFRTTLGRLTASQSVHKQADTRVSLKCLQSHLQAVRPSLCRAVATEPPVVQMPENVVQGLQPQALWNFFQALTQIPRPSKFEDK